MKFNKESNQATGRLLKDSPLFTDGMFFYVVSQRKYIKPADADEDAPTLPTAFVVEQFCPQTWRLVRSQTLYKNAQQDIFTDKKVTDANDYLRASTCHTNGKQLLLCRGEKRYLFDLESGVRVDKCKDDTFKAFVFHDYQHNNFYTILVEDSIYYLSDFSIDTFKTTKVLSSQFSNPVDSFRDAYLKDHISAPATNVIKRKMVK